MHMNLILSSVISIGKLVHETMVLPCIICVPAFQFSYQHSSCKGKSVKLSFLYLLIYTMIHYLNPLINFD